MSGKQQSLQRNMAWRKPVPKLIPSPSRPNSLISSSPAIRPFYNLSSHGRPPLPSNWRETIQKATKTEHFHDRDEATPPGLADVCSSTLADIDRVKGLKEDTEAPSDPRPAVVTAEVVVEKPKPSENPPPLPPKLERRRSTHRSYHPPTPPATVRPHAVTPDKLERLPPDSPRRVVYPGLPPRAHVDGQNAPTYPVYLNPTLAASVAATMDSREGFRFAHASHEPQEICKVGDRTIDTPAMSGRRSKRNCASSAWSRVVSWATFMRFRLHRLIGLSLAPRSVQY